MAHGIIGRQDELAEIDAWLRSDGGRPALLLEGEAGIGKTCVVRSAAAQAEGLGYRMLTCRPTSAEAQLSFAGLGDLLGDALDEVVSTLPAPQQGALRVALLLDEPGDAAPDRRAVGVATLGVLRALALDGPLLVVVDDLQWLDPASSSALEFALRRLDGPGSRILLARRTAAGGSFDPVRTLDDRLAVRTLGPLSLGAVGRVLHADLGPALGRPTVTRIHEAAAGNPLLALEIARALAATGRRLRPGEPLPVPPSVGELLRSRAALLSAAAGEALLAAATLALPTPALIREVIGPAADSALDEAVRAGIIEDEGERLTFVHPLFAAAVDEGAGRAARRAMHARLAELALQPEERARHRFLGREGPDEALAADLEDAGGLALRRGAPASAAELLDAAVQATPPDEVAARARRLLAAANAHLAAGASSAALAAAEEAVATTSEGTVRGGALLLLAEVADDHRAAAGFAARARDEPGAPAAVRSGANLLLAQLALLSGDALAALPHAAEAVATADGAADADVARGFHAHLETILGRPTPGALEAAAARERSSGRLPGYGATVMLALRRLCDGDVDAARAILLEVDAQLTAEGDVGRRVHILRHLVEVETAAGALAAALDRYEEASDLLRGMPTEAAESPLLAAGGRLLASLGRVDEARSLLERGRDLATAAGNRLFALRVRAALGFLELGLGDAEAADTVLRDLPDAYEAAGYVNPGAAGVLPDAIEAALLVGDTERAAALADRLTERAEASTGSWARATATRCRALVLAASGRPVEALAVLDDTASGLGSVRLPLEAGRTLLVRGRIERQSNLRAKARETLTAAADLLDGIPAPLWAAQARAELARVSGRRRADVGALTPTELAIARLVHEGRSNREIAAALHVSVRTVESNLTRTYAKLGVRRRTELALRLAELEV